MSGGKSWEVQFREIMDDMALSGVQQLSKLRELRSSLENPQTTYREDNRTPGPDTTTPGEGRSPRGGE